MTDEPNIAQIIEDYARWIRRQKFDDEMKNVATVMLSNLKTLSKVPDTEEFAGSRRVMLKGIADAWARLSAAVEKNGPIR